jgi:hypothetical protein
MSMKAILVCTPGQTQWFAICQDRVIAKGSVRREVSGEAVRLGYYFDVTF